MRVFVSGATGSLGLPLCLALKEKKYSVIGVGRNQSRLKLLSERGIETIHADLCETDLYSQISSCDFVVHSAALTRPWGPRQEFVAPNLTASRRIFEWSARAQVKKLIHISTTSVYYDGTSRTNLTETSDLPKIQKTSYAATKLESETLAGEFFKNGLSGLILRPRAIVSPYDQTLLPRILAIMSRGFFPMIDNGEGIIDVTPTESIFAAIECAFRAPSEFNGNIYNLTNDEPISIQELLKSIAKSLNLKVRWLPMSSEKLMPLAKAFEKLWPILSNREPRLSCYTLDLISKSQSFNIQKIKSELGYRPAISTERAIVAMSNWRLAK